MTIQEDLRAALGADATLTAIVSDRIYPGEVPDDETPTPWIFYLLPDSTPLDQLDDAAHDVQSDVEFHVLATTYAQAVAIVARIRAVLRVYVGTVVRRSFWSGTSEEVTDEGYHHVVRFRVWWVEEVS